MKRRTKKLSISRMSFIAKTLKEKYQCPCSVELTIWSWLARKEPQVRYTLYIPGSLKKYLSWDELEDAFEMLMRKEIP